MPRVTRYLIANLAGALLCLLGIGGLLACAFVIDPLLGAVATSIMVLGAGVGLARLAPGDLP